MRMVREPKERARGECGERWLRIRKRINEARKGEHSEAVVSK